MKIRIFALAKELGLDNKVLIDYCNAAGINVKSSALASISPEERDQVLEYIRNQGGGGKTTDDQPLAPVRDDAPETTGRLRQIKTVAPRPQPARPQRDTTEAPARHMHPASEAVAVATVDSEEDVTPDVEAEAPSTELEEPTTDAGDTTGAEEAAPAVEAAEAPAEARSTDDDDQQGKDKEKSGPAPLRRDDYVSAWGSVREMRPRGTVSPAEMRPQPTPQPSQQGDQQQRGPLKRSRPALPNIAAPPSYTPPKAKTPKAEEGPAQSPDIRLTPEMLEQKSPLAAHIRRHDEAKKAGKGRKGGAEFDATDLIEAARRGKLGQLAGEEGKAVSRRDQQRRRTGSRKFAEDAFTDESGKRSVRRPRMKRHTGPVALKTSAEIEHPITLRSLSEAMGRPAKDLMRVLFQRGQMVTINTTIEEETALELAMEFGVELEIIRPRDIEDDLAAALEENDPEETLVDRPPIITILGHVDHGKTTLVDKLRATNVAAGEAGGITQHIAAYQVEHNGHKLTFVDTPGHAAFGEMRARGANVTDVVVLVVAADDGVMPQTVECIAHAKSAGVPMVVAMNKIDLPTKNEAKVLQELAQHDVLPAEWGGDTEVVRTSGATGEGLDSLLETLLVTAELNEFKSNPKRPAVGVCLEAFRDEGRGILAWLIVQKGTLRVGDVVLCGPSYGRIRAIYNDKDQEIQEAGPSTPVRVAGLDIIPNAGDHFFVLEDIEQARDAAEKRRFTGRTAVLSRRGGPRTLEEILNAARAGTVQDLPLIIKADTPGSLEALRGEIGKIDHPEVRPQIVHDGVGGVNESDVYLASASGAIIIAFHVVPEDRAEQLAEREGVEIRRFNIIYEVTETIKRSLEGMLIPEKVQVSTGRAIVLQTFSISRFGTIAGCRVLSGTIERSNRVHLYRDQKLVNDYNLASLKRGKEDAREVREGMECGIRLEGFNDIKEGDLLEAYRVDEIKRTLE